MASTMRDGIRAHAAYRFRLGLEVRRDLVRLNLSQNELARHLGLSSGFMSQLLTGRRYVGPRTRRLLMKRLALTFDQLLEEVERP